MIQIVPEEPEFITTADATDLASAITLVNDLKSKYNDWTDIMKTLLRELNRIKDGGV